MTKSLQSLPDVLTPKQAAKFLGISPNFLRQQIREGKIPGKKIGGKFMLSKYELAQYLGAGEPPRIPKIPFSKISEAKRLAEIGITVFQAFLEACEEFEREVSKAGSSNLDGAVEAGFKEQTADTLLSIAKLPKAAGSPV